MAVLSCIRESIFFRRWLPRQVHVRHVREQLDAVPHEVSHGGVHDKAQLQVKTVV